MALDLETVFQNLLIQSPLAGVALYAAKIYMKKHSDAVEQLVDAFRDSNKSCENRYQAVFAELMKIKDSMK
jgi:hypothetical protein